jgi:aromatase
MPTISRTVELDAPIGIAFELSNRIEDWPLMMEDYVKAEIARKIGFKIWFTLTHISGTKWTSWRVLHPASFVAVAERHEPRAPFVFMHHVWTYSALPCERTAMTWRMTYRLLNATAKTEEECNAHLLASTEKNQLRMKSYIDRLHSGARP